MIDLTFAKLALILVNMSIVGCILFLVYQAIIAQLKLDNGYLEHYPSEDIAEGDFSSDRTRQRSND